MLKAQGLIEDWSEPVNPFTSLRLTHREKERLHCLKWGDREVEQDEQQPISIREQRWLASATLLRRAWRLAVLFGLMLDVGGRKMIRRQEIAKCVEPETRQRVEDNWLACNSFECQQLEPPPFLEPERHHTTADLFPIKSIENAPVDTLLCCSPVSRTPAFCHT
jgi:hypothetical protein